MSAGMLSEKELCDDLISATKNIAWPNMWRNGAWIGFAWAHV